MHGPHCVRSCKSTTPKAASDTANPLPRPLDHQATAAAQTFTTALASLQSCGSKPNGAGPGPQPGTTPPLATPPVTGPGIPSPTDGQGAAAANGAAGAGPPIIPPTGGAGVPTFTFDCIGAVLSQCCTAGAPAQCLCAPGGVCAYAKVSAAPLGYAPALIGRPVLQAACRCPPLGSGGLFAG